MLGVGKLGHRGWVDVTTAKHLLNVHLGHTPRGIGGVVVVFGINHQAVEHALHLARDFVQQGVEFARQNVTSNIVVGVETLALSLQALAYLDRYGHAIFFVSHTGQCGQGRVLMWLLL